MNCDLNCSQNEYLEIQEFEQIYAHFIFSTFWLSLAISSFTLYITWKSSTKSMSAYKWCLWNIITSCFLLNFLLASWLPVPIFPIYGGYSSVNISLFHNLTEEQNFVLLMVCLAVFVNIWCSFLNFLFYQISLFKLNFLPFLFKSKWAYGATYMGVYLLWAMPIEMFTWLARADNFDTEIESSLNLISKYPSLAVLVDTEETFGFNSTDQCFIIVLISILGGFFTFFILFSLIFIFISSMSLNQKSQNTLPNTRRIQRSFYHSVCVQTGFSIFTFSLPVFFNVIHTVTPLDMRYKLGMISVMLIFVHSPIINILILCTVSSYRKFLFTNLIPECVQKSKSKMQFFFKNGIINSSGQ